MNFMRDTPFNISPLHFMRILLITQEAEGSFLVRDSSDPSKYLLSLSFKSTERVLHTRIQHDNGVYFFYHQPRPDGYASIPGFPVGGP